MYATLNSGAVNRSLTTADLNVADSDNGPCGLHAALPGTSRIHVSPPLKRHGKVAPTGSRPGAGEDVRAWLLAAERFGVLPLTERSFAQKKPVAFMASIGAHAGANSEIVAPHGTSAGTITGGVVHAAKRAARDSLFASDNQPLARVLSRSSVDYRVSMRNSAT
jgi:hypothetical protein